MTLYYEKLIKNKAVTCRLKSGESVIATAFNFNEIDISFSHKYGEGYDTLEELGFNTKKLEEYERFAKGILAVGTQIVSAVSEKSPPPLVNDLQNAHTMSSSALASNYEGFEGEFPSFKMDVYFILGLDCGSGVVTNTVQSAKELISKLLPKTNASNLDGALANVVVAYTAPNNFSPNSADISSTGGLTIKGTYSLEVGGGTEVVLYKSLMPTSVSYTYSRLRNGNQPIWTKVEITLQRIGAVLPADITNAMV